MGGRWGWEGRRSYLHLDATLLRSYLHVDVTNACIMQVNIQLDDLIQFYFDVFKRVGISQRFRMNTCFGSLQVTH